MIETVLFFALLLVAWIVLFKFIKSIFILKVLFRIVSILLLALMGISIFAGYLIIKDANEFKDNFSKSTNLFVLHEGDSFLSAIELRNSSTGSIEDKFKVLDKAIMEQLEYNYSTGRMDYISKHYYKAFFISIEALESRPEYIMSDNGLNLGKSDVLEILLSDNPKELTADILAGNTGESKEDIMRGLVATDEDIKGYLFSDSLNYFFSPQNLNRFLSELKRGHISVYEDTVMFKAIRYAPGFMMKDTVKNLTSNSTIDRVLGNGVLI
jgi:hypothetical protein